MGAIGKHVTRGDRTRDSHQRTARAFWKSTTGQEMAADLERRILANTPCILCGDPLLDHNEATCDKKLNDWAPTGILNNPTPQPETT